jgi:hypothetical protein
MSEPKTFLVGVYLIDKRYGGPEEGGWWYTAGELVRIVRLFKNEHAATQYEARLNDKLRVTLNKGRRSISSVLSQGQYRAIFFEDFAPQHFPKERPRYE